MWFQVSYFLIDLCVVVQSTIESGVLKSWTIIIELWFTFKNNLCYTLILRVKFGESGEFSPTQTAST